jgi:GT2 family glycosyltransferase
MPSIDIMMPYYGDVAMMQDAVRSILAQDDPDWHLTVVDDGEAAGVPEWFAALDDTRVDYLRNPVNLGVTGNFRKCVELAKRDRMVMMGSDDLMLPDYVTTVRRLEALAPGAGIVQPGVEIIDETGRVVGGGLVDATKRRIYAPKGPGPHRLRGQELAVSLLRGNWLYFPSICWRTEAIKAVGFRPELRTTQDLALELELIERGEQMVIDSAVCFHYRRHLESVSSKMALDGNRFTEERLLYSGAADRMRARGWKRAERAARVHSASRLHALTLLPTAMRGGQTDVAKALAKHAFGNG